MRVCQGSCSLVAFLPSFNISTHHPLHHQYQHLNIYNIRKPQEGFHGFCCNNNFQVVNQCQKKSIKVSSQKADISAKQMEHLNIVQSKFYAL